MCTSNFLSIFLTNLSLARIFLCLVTLEKWLPDNYGFVVFLLWQKKNLTIFKRNCFFLVLCILITIIPAAVLKWHKIILVHNSYTFWASILIFSPVYFFMRHPLHAYEDIFYKNTLKTVWITLVQWLLRTFSIVCLSLAISA